MLRRVLFPAAVALVAAAGTACAAPATPVAPDAGVTYVPPTVAAVEATRQPAAEPTAIAVVQGAAEPAALDEFRRDPAERVAATGRPQLIEFFAFWWGSCIQMRPIVHGLEAEYWGEVDFVYLDVDDPTNDTIKERYGYIAQPYFILIDADGAMAESWFGSRPEDEIKTSLENLLNRDS